MAYEERSISVNGYETDFFDELETFLTKNTVAQFTKTVAYDTTNRSISFAINGLTLTFTGQGSGSSPASTVRIEVNSGRTGSVSNLVAFASGNVAAAGTVTTRTLNLLLIRKGGDVILNIGSRTEIIGQGTIALAVIPNENNYYVYGTAGSRTNWTFIKSDTQEIYTLSPYHIITHTRKLQVSYSLTQSFLFSILQTVSFYFLQQVL